ncbi:MAG: hypothetical protein H6740_25810, partial [Alphaproteobacteria bacterium]|nr:hypothetical protein [Alphaproteobacteria bacterium]
AITLYFSNADPWIDPYDTYHSSQDVPRGGNAPGWHNDQSDKMLEAMRLEFDDNKRNEMFKEWCALYQQEQPITLLIHGLVGVLQNNRFEGVKVRPTGLRANTNWVKPENVKYE